MFNLLHSILRELSFAHRRAIRLLDEAVQHNDALSHESAKENSGDTLGPLEPQLEKTITKGLRVRLTKIGTKSDHSAGQHNIPGS
jgi:hypothetical protein